MPEITGPERGVLGNSRRLRFVLLVGRLRSESLRSEEVEGTSDRKS